MGSSLSHLGLTKVNKKFKNKTLLPKIPMNNDQTVPNQQVENVAELPSEVPGSKPSDNSDKVAELTDLLKRTQANFENYRKQTEKRVAELKDIAAQDMLRQFLQVADTLHLALKHAQEHPQVEDLLEGMTLLAGQMEVLLKEWGVERLSTEGQKFDPYLHEAMMKMPSDKPENIILSEVQQGFTIHDRVLRHAKVVVSAGKKSEQEKMDAIVSEKINSKQN